MTDIYFFIIKNSINYTIWKGRCTVAAVKKDFGKDRKIWSIWFGGSYFSLLSQKNIITSNNENNILFHIFFPLFKITLRLLCVERFLFTTNQIYTHFFLSKDYRNSLSCIFILSSSGLYSIVLWIYNRLSKQECHNRKTN